MKKLIDTAWSAFSTFIRLRDADRFGVCSCISCGKRYRWKDMDAGHYIPKTAGMIIYFDEDNVNAQCKECNQFKSGNIEKYRIGLIEKIGLKRVERLEKNKVLLIKKNSIDFEKLTKLYKNKAEKLFFKL